MIWLWFIQIAFAAETDGFTPRYNPVPNALPMINKRVQELVAADILNLNQKFSKTCDWSELDTALGVSLRRFVYGKIEGYINTSSDVPKTQVAFDQSIYNNIPKLFYYTILLGSKLGFGFATNIHHDGLLIGADKFGHFLDEGYDVYVLVQNIKIPLEKVLDISDFSERSISGEWTSGIVSYGDLAANYDGYRFWTDVLGSSEDRSISKYFSCTDGVWTIQQKIDFGTYMNAAWDEGMNCNQYRTPEFTAMMDENVKRLEFKDKKRYQCPVYPDRVATMIARYGDKAKYVLNPVVFKK